MVETSGALRDAAALLLGEAQPATVRAVLRLLLDDVAPAPAAAPLTPSPQHQEPPAVARPRNDEVSDGWEALRKEVRNAMGTRGVSYAALAAAIGSTEVSAKIMLQRTRPASGPMMLKLSNWLADAPEVAANAATFRGTTVSQAEQPAAAA